MNTACSYQTSVIISVVDQLSTLRRLISLLLIAISLNSCALLPEPHRIDIIQGNKLEIATVKRLKLGMSKQQVRFLLGPPSIQDMFHPDRWDYIDYTDIQHQTLVNRRLTLFFEDDRLMRVDGDLSHEIQS